MFPKAVSAHLHISSVFTVSTDAQRADLYYLKLILLENNK